ncbi:hypothetical protein MRX96_014685 [Rhipicephalus microplus]
MRICVNFTEFNYHVLREWHPMLSVQHTLGLLHGAKVHSPNSMPTLDFGKFHFLENQENSPPSSHRLGASTSTDYHLALRQLLKTSRSRWPTYYKASVELSVTWTTSSSVGFQLPEHNETPLNLLQALERLEGH